MYAPTEENSDDSKDIFYGEMQHVFSHHFKYHMNILFTDITVKLKRILSNRQLGMTVYIRIEMKMVLD
jgi:hypothetical protein